MSYHDDFEAGYEEDYGYEECTILCKELKYETDKAYLIRIGKKEYWFPKSQCEFDEKSLILTLPFWLVEDKELEDFVIEDDYD
jgi:hypothetical protein